MTIPFRPAPAARTSARRRTGRLPPHFAGPSGKEHSPPVRILLPTSHVTSARLFLAALAVALCLPAARAQTYVLASPNATLNSDQWALSSANLSGFRGAITNPAYFGPTGTVKVSLSLLDLGTVSPATLAGVQGFMAPWWSNTQSTPHVSTLLTAFYAGLDLWLLEDDSAHNAIGTALGLVASSANGSASNGTAPFFSGPFGTAANTATFGNFAQLDAANVAALKGTVIGRNAANQITAVYWPRGTFAAGSGSLIWFSDVDMISNWSQNPYSPALNANGTLALNTTAAFVLATPIPEPATVVLLVLGTLVVAVVSRRRRTGRP